MIQQTQTAKSPEADVERIPATPLERPIERTPSLALSVPKEISAAPGQLGALEGYHHDLAASVDELKLTSVASPPVEQSIQPPGIPGEPGIGPIRLQDVLPAIRALADKVGGLEPLAELIDMLKESKE